jgi:DNA-binding transcriptional MocR family regulator
MSRSGPPESLTRVARLLRGWETRGELTLPERLAAAIIELIDQGELPAGFRLPSERRLADTLAISRGTVSAAYGELRADGWLDSRVGSGSRVMSVRGRPAADRTRVDGRLATVAEHDAALDLTSGALPGLPTTAVLAQRAVRERLPRLLAGNGYEPQGLAELRAAVSAYYGALGAPTRPEEVAITTGSQQALQLLADAFVAPGDTVLIEDPTYRGAIEIFHSRGARLVPVPVLDDGPDPDALHRLVQRLRPRVVYMLPIAHNPTGFVVDRERAQAIAAVLAASEAIFFEDGTPADLVLDRSRPPTPIGVDIPAERWVSIGSISKLYWGGLRIGWIRAPCGVIERMTRIKTATDLGTSLVSQAIAIECLQGVEAARAERRAELLASLDDAEALLRERAPEWSWRRPQGGSALWVRVPHTDTRSLAEAGRRHGVAVVPGSFFSAVDGFADRIRVPFWGGLDDLRAGIELLVGAWRGGSPSSSSTPLDWQRR